MDKAEVDFWPSAFIISCEYYFVASDEFWTAFKSDMRNMNPSFKVHERLTAYNVLTSAGQLVRTLRRLGPACPPLVTAADSSPHLIAEASILRNMVEHADEYYAKKGHKQAEFVREGAPRPGITAAATSTIITEQGHFLGGRFCVELALAEVRAFQPLLAEIEVDWSAPK